MEKEKKVKVKADSEESGKEDSVDKKSEQKEKKQQ